MEVFHCTPSEEELLPEREIQCTFNGCKSVFTNAGNLDMHLQRHHGKEPSKRSDFNGKQCVFHCPKIQCTYHEHHTSKMHFKTLKYLRQHYKKVHASKINICDKCGKAFISVNQLKTHMEKLCGIKYTCLECGWDYSSKEALLTHGKRKGHEVRDNGLVERKSKHLQKTQSQQEASQSNDQETQTEVLPMSKYVAKSDISTETEDIHAYGKHASTNTHSPTDIETQTESNMLNTMQHTTYNNLNTTLNNSLSTVQFLPPSIHTYTQTYDDLFTDSLLGFTDIQTQTNWSSFADAATDAASNEDVSVHHYNTSSAGTCTRCASDELLVSTETQTSFTQCLLESRTANGDTEDGNFSLYQTQHTQTCDMLLGALFGAQESDLIGGFQSTYTQT
ncbi:myoneurin isoform X2 [Bactrocera neohumeralis]|uniref:myoneurin isoform X2 n=1 Tax=Bactrocera tryoni TaxID=59916 RepID=UPI001A983559|nr:myoneurin isoform X2 [Bactrocera tryoni]XP_050337265.1 myoneurin isoform X2 [Bactrocera neohumeralis]